MMILQKKCVSKYQLVNTTPKIKLCVCESTQEERKGAANKASE